MDRTLETVVQAAPLLAKGCGYTLLMAAVGMTAGLFLGFWLALGRLSSVAPMRWAASAYVSAFRGTPLLVQLFVIYYGLPQFGVRLDPLAAAVVGFSLNTAAYAGEILRGAIAGVDRGQWEAAASLGMTRSQTLRRVILPQAARAALPALGNSFVSLVKDTSLAATIQVPELFRQAQLVTARTYEIFGMYLAAAAVYWLMSSVLSAGQEAMERRAARHLTSARP
jgi:L-cystine transport system permease protein